MDQKDLFTNLITRSAMDQMDRLTNPMVDCAETIKHLDLEAWKEKGSVDKTCEVDVSSFYLYLVR